MNEMTYYYKIKSDDTICLYRVYGNEAEVHIPSFIQNRQITEIADYCFSQRNKIPADICVEGNSQGYELAGNEIQSIYLPDSIEKIGSFAFYNCRELAQISISSSIQEIGSDVFINCHQLHHIQIRDHVSKPTLLKQILTQISWDIDVHFEDCSLFYPEYYEMYDEIGPAHIFSLNISGEGFRLRQCFQNGIVSLSEYDRTFEKLCVEESAKTLAHFVSYRFIHRPEFYQDYVQKHQLDISKWIIQNDSVSNALKFIKLMIEKECINQDTLQELIQFATTNNYIELVTKLIDYKQKYFKPTSKYEFEDF